MRAMKRRATLRIFSLSVAIVLIAGGVIWFVSGPATAPEAPSPPPASGLLSEDQIVLEVRPTAESVPDVVRQVFTRASALLDALPPERAVRHDRGAFLELLRKRVELLIDPDFEEWVQHAMSFGGRPSGPMTNPEYSLVVYDPQDPDPDFREKWERVAAGFRLTPLSVDGMRVTCPPNTEPS